MSLVTNYLGYPSPFPPIHPQTPSKAQQLRIKADALREKAKLTEEKVSIASKNAEISEKVHQIKTSMALQIVFEAKEIARDLNSELSGVIDEIRKQQYLDAAFAAVDAANAQRLVASMKEISQKLARTADMVESAADAGQVTGVELIGIIHAVETEEQDLQDLIRQRIDIEKVILQKEREHREALDRVKKAGSA